MKIDVEEHLIEPNERNSFMIDDEINNFLKNDEGQNIKADIELLKSMGFDKKMINKVYILLRPENIERAIDYMTEIDGVYQHDFIPSSNPNERSLCFICKKPINNHLDYIPDDLLIDADLNNNNLINKQKEDFYQKYQEQNIINEKISNQLNENKNELNEIKKKLEETKIKNDKLKTRPKSSNKRKYLIKELQKKIENYKFRSLKNSYNDDF